MLSYDSMDVDALAVGCRREIERYWSEGGADVGYGYALFCRAIEDRDDVAWEHIVDIYRNRVLIWIRMCKAWRVTYRPAGYFYADVVVAFWQSIGKVFSRVRFPSLGSILGYLKVVAQRTVASYCRYEGRYLAQEDIDNVHVAPVGVGRPVEGAVIHKHQRAYLWLAIEQEVRTSAERVVAIEGLALNRSAPEVWRRYPDLFGGGRRVSVVRDSLVKRLRRKWGNQSGG